MGNGSFSPSPEQSSDGKPENDATLSNTPTDHSPDVSDRRLLDDRSSGLTPPTHFPVVGIGASAGGLHALKEFFAHVRDDAGFSYVVVVHLSSEHKSQLAELLQANSSIPIQQVTESVQLEPNKAYVIPPGANIATVDTYLRLSEIEASRAQRSPINHFFQTLARSHGGRASAIILSGTGSDGTLGVRHVKQAGGLTIVQSPGESEFNGMPESAIAGRFVDLVLPISEMPGAVARFMEFGTRVRIPLAGPEAEQAQVPELRHLLQKLRFETGRDFSFYKRPTMLRRIARRMQLHQLDTLEAYLHFLSQRPAEVQLLADELLITVTQFFRDTHVFEHLKSEVIPKLLQQKSEGEQVRVWSVGCATGEEAYSLAILFAENDLLQQKNLRLQIFASDLHDRSLHWAREGLYPADIEADVSPERLGRFFHHKDGGYQINPEIREFITFAPHNLISDPPFSQLDLLCCRNVFIYLQRELQRDVLELFHYALKVNGTLLLGPSETTDSSKLFHLVDKKCCVYSKSAPAYSQTLPALVGEKTSAAFLRRDLEKFEAPASYRAIHQQLVEEFSPASLLINGSDNIVYVTKQANRFLAFPEGEMTHNIFRLVRDELQGELKAAVSAVRVRDQLISTQFLGLPSVSEHCNVRMHLKPTRDQRYEGCILVVFEELHVSKYQREGQHVDGSISSTWDLSAAKGSPSTTKSGAGTVEDYRRQLSIVLEQHEVDREELRASNEELQSSNEELRSTLEELETSREELQSMNEELQSMNQENRKKVKQLGQLADDLQNLFAATDIATLFLDRQLRIFRFTPKISDLFNVRASDRGRSLTDFTHCLGYDSILEDAAQVLKDLIPLEHEIQDRENRWYLTRLMPYRSAEDRIDGVVITFVEITEQKNSELELRQSNQRLQRMMSVEGVCIMRFNDAGTLLDVNATFCELFGYSSSDVESGKLNWRTLTPPESQEVCDQILKEMSVSGRIGPLEREYLRKDGTRIWMVFAGTDLGDGTVVGYCIDISENKRVEQALKESEERLKIAAEVTGFGTYDYDMETGVTQWSDQLLKITGRSAPPLDPIQENRRSVHPDDQAEFDRIVRDAMDQRSNGKHDAEFRIIRPDGEIRWVRDVGQIIYGEKDGKVKPIRIVGTIQDITQRREAVQALKDADRRKNEFLALLAHELRNPLAPIRTSLDVLRASKDDAETIDYVHATLDRQTKQLTALVNDLLDVSRISQGKLELRKIRASLHEVIQAAVEASEALIGEAGHELTVTLPEGPVYIFADPVRISQVTSNLLNNAAKYTPNGGKIEISCQVENDCVVMAVKDTGVGIPAEMLEKVFDLFTQVDRKHGDSGLGIGLTLVRSLVEMHDGRILVHSDGQNRGTCVTISLPLYREEIGVPQSSKHDSQLSQARTSILVVDDNRSAADMMKIVLKNLGHEVMVAYNGRQAIQIAEKQPPEVIVMDIGMPEMDGLEVANRIRAETWGQNIILVALTGWGQEHDRERTRQAGFDTHLVKPTDVTELIAAIQRAKAAKTATRA